MVESGWPVPDAGQCDVHRMPGTGAGRFDCRRAGRVQCPLAGVEKTANANGFGLWAVHRGPTRRSLSTSPARERRSFRILKLHRREVDTNPGRLPPNWADTVTPIVANTGAAVGVCFLVVARWCRYTVDASPLVLRPAHRRSNASGGGGFFDSPYPRPAPFTTPILRSTCTPKDRAADVEHRGGLVAGRGRCIR